MLKSLRLYKGTTGYITTTHYSVNAVGHYYTTECYSATCRYSLSVFATVCYGQNQSLLMTHKADEVVCDNGEYFSMSYVLEINSQSIVL